MSKTEVTLICDGSLDANDRSYESQKGTLLGGYAGGISVDTAEGDEHFDFYTSSVPSLPTSSLVELRALEHGLFRLKRLIEKHDLKVDKLKVYTDSQDAVKNYNALRADPNAEKAYYRKPVLRLISRIKQMGIEDVDFDYVKAHVDNDIATPIEKMHNVVDKAALNARWSSQRHAFDPEGVAESPFYGVIMDTTVKPSDAITLREFAYNMAMKGMQARVAFEGKRLKDGLIQHHPFIEGLNMAAVEKGVDPRSLWSNCGKIYKEERDSGMMGYDTTYVNHHYFQQGREVPRDLMKAKPGFNAAIAARVYMGQGVRQIFNERNITGRLAPPSQAVFNFGSLRHKEEGDPFCVSAWADAYKSAINIHQEQSLKNAVAYSSCGEVPPLRHEFADFFDSLNALSESMEPEQISNQIIAQLEGDGFEVSEELKVTIRDSAYEWVSSGDTVSFHDVMKGEVVDAVSHLPHYPHRSQMPQEPTLNAEPEVKQERETLSLSR